MQTTNAETTKTRLIAIFGLVTLVFGSTAVAQVENRHRTHRTRYRVVDLGTLAENRARDGEQTIEVGSPAFRLFPAIFNRGRFSGARGVMADLGTLGGPNS